MHPSFFFLFKTAKKPLTLFYLHLGPSVLWCACLSFSFLFAVRSNALFLLHRGPPFLCFCVCVVFPGFVFQSTGFSYLQIGPSFVLQEVWASFWPCILVLDFVLITFRSSAHPLWHLFAFFFGLAVWSKGFCYQQPGPFELQNALLGFLFCLAVKPLAF